MIKIDKIKKFRRINSGYTIIETMISISLFLVIVISGMGALLNANLLHAKSQSMRSIMDNLSFIMEDMSKNLRIGYNYHCLSGGSPDLSNATLSVPLSCANGWGIAFESADGSTSNTNDEWVYYIDTTGKMFKTTSVPGVMGYADVNNYVQLNPDEVIIDTSQSFFSILGAEDPTTGDKQQPFINIRLVGKITFKNITTPFSLQTSVSQRLINI